MNRVVRTIPATEAKFCKEHLVTIPTNFHTCLLLHCNQTPICFLLPSPLPLHLQLLRFGLLEMLVRRIPIINQVGVNKNDPKNQANPGKKIDPFTDGSISIIPITF